MIYLVDSDPAFDAELERLRGLGGPGVLRTHGDEALETVIRDPDADVAVVGSTMPLDEIVAAVEEAATTRPDMGAVVIREAGEVDAARDLLAGAAFVVEHGDLDRLIACVTKALQRATSLRWRTEDLVSAAAESARQSPATLSAVPTGSQPEPPETSKVIVVTSPKGGCGRTTAAVNLALALAAQEPEESRRVCLVDLGLTFGDASITLGLTPSRTIGELAGVEDELDEDVLAPIIDTTVPGVGVLAAPADPAIGETIEAEVVVQVLATLGGMYSFIVVDTRSEYSDPTIAALDAADHILMMTTPEIAALKDVRLALNSFRLMEIPNTKIKIILNRDDPKSGVSASDVAKTLEQDLAATLPASTSVVQATNRSAPIVAADPMHEVSREYTRLAASISGKEAETAAPDSKKGLFGRFRGRETSEEAAS